MSGIIDFPGGGSGSPPPPTEPGRDHVICDKPLRLRWGDWRTQNVLQIHVQAAAIFEDYRADCLAKGLDPSGQVPAGFTLDGGMHQTALALLRFKANEERQVEVIYLSALMEALVNTPCAILRTDLIRRVYQEVDALSASLGLRWSGRVGHFMLPLNEDARAPNGFARQVAPLASLKDFFGTLKAIAQERYGSLKKGYVLYYPYKGGI
ncbi:MAG: hypothetical protein ABIK12_17355 [Pseudomonadota bacterium]